MNNFVRSLIAGYGAKKLGGGCFSTILIFIVIYFVLGKTCNNNNNVNNGQLRHTYIQQPIHSAKV